uniref:Uncharacterized protein n=1 Tax=Rhizophora mucronata TaxID=61149 RepID=A0A2P2P3E2_RHIMU
MLLYERSKLLILFKFEKVDEIDSVWLLWDRFSILLLLRFQSFAGIILMKLIVPFSLRVS